MGKVRTVGETIRDARKARKWSLEKLAAESGVPRSSLGRIELGDQIPDVHDAHALALALRISLVLGHKSRQPRPTRRRRRRRQNARAVAANG